MIFCKVCGKPLIGRYLGDVDETLYHAWFEHFDLWDSYCPSQVREIIEKTGRVDTKQGQDEE
jgi:hypothetical protein